jgi:hypothetical protein
VLKVRVTSKRCPVQRAGEAPTSTDPLLVPYLADAQLADFRGRVSHGQAVVSGQHVPMQRCPLPPSYEQLRARGACSVQQLFWVLAVLLVRVFMAASTHGRSQGLLILPLQVCR